MNMRKVQFANDEYYHIYNRGVDKRDIFLCDDDFWRFYASMYLFNDENFKSFRGIAPLLVPLLSYGNCRNLVTARSVTERKPFVDILSYCLIPNHFHLFVKQLIENGISIFLHRLTKGYSRYFNIKNERTGTLFEDSFKAVHINHEGQFLHLPRYIHLNVVDLIEPNWRQEGVEDWERTLDFMKNYKWSSHGVYLGKPQPIEVVSPSFLRKIFQTPEGYLKFLKSWAVKDWGSAKDFYLE